MYPAPFCHPSSSGARAVSVGTSFYQGQLHNARSTLAKSRIYSSLAPLGLPQALTWTVNTVPSSSLGHNNLSVSSPETGTKPHSSNELSGLISQPPTD